MFEVLMVIGGFFVLIYGAHLLVDGSASLAKQLKVPTLITGLTIVAFGTSMPEFMVNLLASFNEKNAVVLGNVIGSNIFNVLVILGIGALIRPLTVKTSTTWIEIPLCFLASLIVLVAASDKFLDGTETSFISRVEGIVLLCLFAIFLGYNINLSLNSESDEELSVKERSTRRSIWTMIIGLFLLIIGGRLIVDGAVSLANAFRIPERIIAITVISIGTSLPELATSLVAVKKGNVDIAIGNVVGSNIFNIFFILGFSMLVTPAPIGPKVEVDLLINILASILLFAFIFTGKGRKLEWWEGIIFLIIYIGYLTWLAM